MAGNFRFSIFINDDEIYSGDFGEVPEKKRASITNDLAEWSGSLGKRGLNELIYSHLAWYEEKDLFCSECGARTEDGAGGECARCGGEMVTRYVHERSAQLDMIMTCVGMITEVKITRA
ncbi:MAG: hypothetical protein KJ002_00590 [Candidatus Dadabacteria bacterium]|nr:hypothetical protein [Candidatus Dadabacteria bacterium]